MWRAGARGWVAGRAGLWGALATWVLGSAAPAPRFLGTQPPYATQVVNWGLIFGPRTFLGFAGSRRDFFGS